MLLLLLYTITILLYVFSTYIDTLYVQLDGSVVQWLGHLFIISTPG